ncbi:hypothetical protein GJ744_009173 [Endocarpon pusillum]|uniref:Uncharacterized protein n=1 Tax=Endocarpon pusillum TaxID=364733 RepID=A0A8H7ANT5_9EURO|nr:hypothetical protein GJ744_009173 [Endocarpon pusillum]
MPLEVLSPRPTRPFKRKLLEEENSNTDYEPKRKRQCPSSSVTTHCLQRSRSDSFLIQAMSSGRPQREIRTPRRYEDGILPRGSSVPIDAKQSITNRSPASLPYPYSPSVTPASFSTDAPTPATSFTDDCRSSSRVKSPYRDDLLRNNIAIEPRGPELLDSVKEYGYQVLNRPRASPGLQESQVESAMDTIYSVRNEDEETIKSGYMYT